MDNKFINAPGGYDEDTYDYINFYPLKNSDYVFNEHRFFLQYAKFLLNKLLMKFRKQSGKDGVK
jgi:hypothetical protein